MKTNRIKIAVTAAAASALLLAGCGSGDSDTDTGTAEDTDAGEATEVEDDPTQPFWDAWEAGGNEYHQEMCWALEDFGYDWAVDYGEEEPMDSELWADTLVEACDDWEDTAA